MKRSAPFGTLRHQYSKKGRRAQPWKSKKRKPKSAGASHGNYTVTTQDKTDEITAPTRVVTLVNVNTATAEELETLTGIGPSLAQAIIDYRAEHGDFTAAEDLLNVKGIGEAKLEGFRAEITFTEEDGDENSGG